jgi:broad specificity phosphatase PhoE
MLYFARHGESIANTGNIISNRDLAHPLTPTGRLSGWRKD